MSMDLDALCDLLQSAAGSPMQTVDWISACYYAFAAPGDRQIVGVHRAHDICAFAPMVRVGRGLMTRLHVIGVDKLYEPTDLVAVDDEAMQKLAETLVKSGMPFTLGRLPRDSKAVEAVKTACRRHASLIERDQNPYPFIPLTDGWDAPESKLSSRRRSDVGRAWRQAYKMGSVSTSMFCPKPEEVNDVLDKAMAVESSSWKGAQGDDMKSDRPVGEFFRDYARRTAASGNLRIGFLHINDEIAAMQIGTIYADSFWVLKVGYDPRFQKASPGILLMVEAIKYAHALGLATYELLGTAEAWTRVWTQDERPSVSLRVYPYNLRGALAFATDASGKLWGRTRRRSKAS